MKHCDTITRELETSIRQLLTAHGYKTDKGHKFEMENAGRAMQMFEDEVERMERNSWQYLAGGMTEEDLCESLTYSIETLSDDLTYIASKGFHANANRVTVLRFIGDAKVWAETNFSYCLATEKPRQ